MKRTQDDGWDKAMSVDALSGPVSRYTSATTSRRAGGLTWKATRRVDVEAFPFVLLYSSVSVEERNAAKEA
jgi:hypothetical protein